MGPPFLILCRSFVHSFHSFPALCCVLFCFLLTPPPPPNTSIPFHNSVFFFFVFFFRYPANVTLLDIFRFIAFPTLCYQTSYPRTASIRKVWLLKRLLELFLTLAAQGIVFNQLMLPVLLEALLAKRTDGEDFAIMKYVLKLAVPSLVCWLGMFYSLFHLHLNILAEVTYFGDRLYYKAWWNATKLDVYWRDWNIPVHAWLVRHVFFPCMNIGLSKSVSTFLVFFTSAVAHEVLVSVPCHTNKLWAFYGMMGQLPLIAFTNFLDRNFQGSQVGNFVFWVSFCIVGQPLCILLYFIEVAEIMAAK